MDHKLIIDADPGIGDALALALALLDPELDVVAVTATAGRVSGKDATRNVQTVVELLDPPKWPRIGGCTATAPAAYTPAGDPVHLDGPTGLGDCEFPVAALHHMHESARLMVEIVRDQPNEIMLLALGPLTNVELASELEPAFLGMLRGLVFLGGAVGCGGDATAAAEFNVFANPEAARNVLLARATKTLVPLDVSKKPVLTMAHCSRIGRQGNSPMCRFLDQVLPFAFRSHHEHLGQEGICLHEVAALCSIARPRLFESRSMEMDVETAGDLTRGMTVFDRRDVKQWQTNIDVLTDVDAQGVIDYVTHQVGRSV